LSEPFDHAGANFAADPHAAFQKWRPVGAVRHGTSRWPFISLFRYDDIKRALCDWRTWSSEIPAIRELLLGDAAVMVQDDPPRHTVFRRCVAPHLSPRQLARDGLDIAAIVARRVTPLFETGGDAVEDVGAQIALDVILGLVGLPASDRDYLREWTNRFSRAVGAELASTDEVVLENQRRAITVIHAELSEYVLRIIRDGPKLGGLIERSADWPISSEDRVGLIKSIAFAGNHTSALMIANTLWLFSQFPDQLERLRRGAAVDAATEEVFRFKAVFRGITRIATRSGTLRGVTFHPGDNLLMWLTSGNFDPDSYLNAERFDITRDGPAHLAFAVGPHHCVGAALARAEITALVGLLARRASAIVLKAEPQAVDDPWVDGFERLELRILENGA